MHSRSFRVQAPLALLGCCLLLTACASQAKRNQLLSLDATHFRNSTAVLEDATSPGHLVFSTKGAFLEGPSTSQKAGTADNWLTASVNKADGERAFHVHISANLGLSGPLPQWTKALIQADGGPELVPTSLNKSDLIACNTKGVCTNNVEISFEIPEAVVRYISDPTRGDNVPWIFIVYSTNEQIFLKGGFTKAEAEGLLSRINSYNTIIGEPANNGQGRPPVAHTSAPTAPELLPNPWRPIIEGADTILADTSSRYFPGEMKLSNGRLLRKGDWEGYLKDLVASFPPETRDSLIDGLTRYWTGYDKVDRIIRFEPLRYISEPYAKRSYISARGYIKDGKAFAWIEIKYRSEDWLFAKSVKVAADDFTWESGPLEFERDHYQSVWEWTLLDLPTHRELLNKIIESKDATVRFYGAQYYSDMTVTRRMKDDLKALLKAIDIINNTESG